MISGVHMKQRQSGSLVHSPSSTAKTVFYDNDGTGRDLYIGPSGGLHNEYAFKNPRAGFVDNLRSYRVNDEQRRVYARSK